MFGRCYILKKIIPLLFALALILCGCSEPEKPPVKTADTSFDAVYKTGDFSFNCTVKWQNKTAFVTVNSTNAEGLTMSCDGREVTFSRGNMIKRENKENVDATNPARLLWEIFTALENGGDKCSLGAFAVEKNDDMITQISVGNISIVCSNK